MKYDDTYEIHSTLVLDSGIELTLDSIYQARVYEGLLEGVPNIRSNKQTINRFIELAKGRECLDGEEPLLISPIKRNQRSVNYDPDYQPYGDEEWLPSIVCIARFESLYTLTPDAGFTTLCIVWFQEDFPIDTKYIMKINWPNESYSRGW